MTSVRPVSARGRGAAGSRARSAMLAAATILALLQAAGARAEEYLLGPQDRLRIKLVEWRPGNGVAVDWESLSDEYSVGAAGRVAIPMLGEFQAWGKSPTALSIEIAEQLRKRVGLSIRPEVSVEVESYRPFYVLGAVDKPGEYAFRPDVTALQALGIAGGMYRPADPGLLRMERDRIMALGLLEENRAALSRGLVREARLLGELKDRVEFEPPAEIDIRGLDAGSVKALIADEVAIARTRAATYENQMKAAAKLMTLLDGQIATLASKIGNQDKQVDISRRELQTVTALMSQGLAITSRQFALQRAVSDDEGKRLDYEMAILTARQDRQKAEQTQVDLTNERRTKILDELSTVRGELATARAKVRAQEDLVVEASVTAPRSYVDRERIVREQKSIFVLSRRLPDGSPSVVVVDEATTLRPGDVLRVEALVPEGASGSRSVREAEVR